MNVSYLFAIGKAAPKEVGSRAANAILYSVGDDSGNQDRK